MFTWFFGKKESDRIKDLEEQIAKKDKVISQMKLENHLLVSRDEYGKLNAAFKKQRKELETMYLEAVGNAKTVKWVKVILSRYKRQFPPTLVSSTSFSGSFFNVGTHISQIVRDKSEVEKAAETKIKRLNRDIVIKNCECLEHAPDDAGYAHVMMSMMKEIAGKEVNGTRILEAKKAGLDPMSVFKSMLAIYNVKQDDVM